MLEKPRTQAKERAQEEARQQADAARDEVGRMAYEMLDEYFPEQAKKRRQSSRARVLLVGIAIGVLLDRLVNR